MTEESWKARWLTRRNVARFVLVITAGMIIGLFYPQTRKQDEPVRRLVYKDMAATDCNLSEKYCNAVADGLSVQVRLPFVIRASKPFPVRVVVRQSPPQGVSAVTVSFAMKGMDMGVNRYRLQKTSEGEWTALVVLPVCTQGRTDWKMKLSFSSADVIWQTAFPFTSR